MARSFPLLAYYCLTFFFYFLASCFFGFFVGAFELTRTKEPVRVETRSYYSDDAGLLGTRHNPDGSVTKTYSVALRSLEHTAGGLIEFILSGALLVILDCALFTLTVVSSLILIAIVLKRALICLGFTGAWQSIDYGENRVIIAFAVTGLWIIFPIGFCPNWVMSNFDFTRIVFSVFITNLYWLSWLMQIIILWPFFLIIILIIGVALEDVMDRRKKRKS